MLTNDITKIMNFQGVKATDIKIGETNVVIYIHPTDHVQDCPCCNSKSVIRKGTDGDKEVNHLPIMSKKCVLVLPKIRMKCKDCFATFNWSYDFVTGKQRYTNEYKNMMFNLAIGSTVQHVSAVLDTAYSTVERYFKEILLKVAPLTEQAALEVAQKSTRLILGIDDFAIRKGHSYNTGLHDLRGETFLALVKGRSLSELREFAKSKPEISNLNPVAVVMDLAKHYHTFIAEIYPNAVRVADRFHVNHYILEALNDVRRRVERESSHQVKRMLKRNKHLLNKRGDELADSEKNSLNRLLCLSKDLKSTYEFKEMLIDWYDCSINYKIALTAFDKWCAYGDSLNISEVKNALKTFKNWKTEITNYHLFPFTNGVVEGRNGKIKSLQRRRYFLRNRSFYSAIIMLECNKDIYNSLAR